MLVLGQHFIYGKPINTIGLVVVDTNTQRLPGNAIVNTSIRWCYQKIYRKNPDSWGDELRRRISITVELDALRQEKEESGESRESGYIEDKLFCIIKITIFKTLPLMNGW